MPSRHAVPPEHLFRLDFPAWSGRLLAVLVLAAFGLLPGRGASQTAVPEQATPLRGELVIATKEAPPFAFKGADGAWRGISIDLWNRIAQQLHLRYRFSEQATVEGLIDGTRAGSFDAAVAALTVTAA